MRATRKFLREPGNKLGLTTAERLVLLLHADLSNSKTGLSWPAVQTLAEESGLAESTVQGARKRLRELGLLVEVHRGSGRSPSRYRVLLRSPASRTPEESSQPDPLPSQSFLVVPRRTAPEGSSQPGEGSSQPGEGSSRPDTSSKEPEDTEVPYCSNLEEQARPVAPPASAGAPAGVATVLAEAKPRHGLGIVWAPGMTNDDVERYIADVGLPAEITDGLEHQCLLGCPDGPSWPVPAHHAESKE